MYQLIRSKLVELNEGNSDLPQFHLIETEKQKMFVDPDSLANSISPKDNPEEYFFTFRHHHKNETFLKWLRKKINLFNETKTVFCGPEEASSEEFQDVQQDEVCENSAWSDYSRESELTVDEVDEDPVFKIEIPQ